MELKSYSFLPSCEYFVLQRDLVCLEVLQKEDNERNDQTLLTDYHRPVVHQEGRTCPGLNYSIRSEGRYRRSLPDDAQAPKNSSKSVKIRWTST